MGFALRQRPAEARRSPACEGPPDDGFRSGHASRGRRARRVQTEAATSGRDGGGPPRPRQLPPHPGTSQSGREADAVPDRRRDFDCGRAPGPHLPGRLPDYAERWRTGGRGPAGRARPPSRPAGGPAGAAARNRPGRCSSSSAMARSRTSGGRGLRRRADRCPHRRCGWAGLSRPPLPRPPAGQPVGACSPWAGRPADVRARPGRAPAPLFPGRSRERMPLRTGERRGGEEGRSRGWPDH